MKATLTVVLVMVAASAFGGVFVVAGPEGVGAGLSKAIGPEKSPIDYASLAAPKAKHGVERVTLPDAAMKEAYADVSARKIMQESKDEPFYKAHPGWTAGGVVGVVGTVGLLAWNNHWFGLNNEGGGDSGSKPSDSNSSSGQNANLTITGNNGPVSVTVTQTSGQSTDNSTRTDRHDKH